MPPPRAWLFELGSHASLVTRGVGIVAVAVVGGVSAGIASRQSPEEAPGEEAKAEGEEAVASGQRREGGACASRAGGEV